jgi:hypothetical protein
MSFGPEQRAESVEPPGGAAPWFSDLLNFNIDPALDQTKVGDVSAQYEGAVPFCGQCDQTIVLEFASLVDVEPLVVPDGADKPAGSQPVLGKGSPDLGRRPRQTIERPLRGAVPSAPVKLAEHHGALPQHIPPRELIQAMRQFTLEVANDHIRIEKGVAGQTLAPLDLFEALALGRAGELEQWLPGLLDLLDPSEGQADGLAIGSGSQNASRTLEGLGFDEERFSFEGRRGFHMTSIHLAWYRPMR